MEKLSPPDGPTAGAGELRLAAAADLERVEGGFGIGWGIVWNVLLMPKVEAAVREAAAVLKELKAAGYIK
jgi:hypothetical protein